MRLNDRTDWRISRNNFHNSFLFGFQWIRILNLSCFIKLVISLQNRLEEPLKYGFSFLVSHVTDFHSYSGNIEPFYRISENVILVVDRKLFFFDIGHLPVKLLIEFTLGLPKENVVDRGFCGAF